MKAKFTTAIIFLIILVALYLSFKFDLPELSACLSVFALITGATLRELFKESKK